MNCDIGSIFPAPWDEPETPSQALQSHGGEQVRGEKEEESTYVNLFDFIRDKLALYLNRHEQKAKSMTNGIEKLLWFEKRTMKRGNLGTDVQWGKENLFSTNIFSYLTCPGKVVFISSLDTSLGWGEDIGDWNELANFWAKEQSTAWWLLQYNPAGCAGSWPPHRCRHHISAPHFCAERRCLSCTGARQGRQGKKASWNEEPRVQTDSHCQLAWKCVHPSNFCGLQFPFPNYLSLKRMKVAEPAWQSKHPSPSEPSPLPSSTQNFSKQLCRLIPTPQARHVWAAHVHTAVGEPHHGWPHGSNAGCSPCIQGPLQQAGHADTTLVHFIPAQEHIISHHTIDINCMDQLFWHETICHVSKFILGDTCCIHGTGWSMFPQGPSLTWDILTIAWGSSYLGFNEVYDAYSKFTSLPSVKMVLDQVRKGNFRT